MPTANYAEIGYPVYLSDWFQERKLNSSTHIQTLLRKRVTNKPIIIPVPYYKQETEFTCGPAVLKMVMHYNGDYFGERWLRKHAKTSPTDGTNHEKLIKASRKLGYHCFVKQNSNPREIKQFINRGYPVIINWQEPDTKDGHYSVLFGYYGNYVYIHDPYKPQRKIIALDKLTPLWHDGGQQKWFMVASKYKIDTSMRGKLYLPT